MKRLPPRSVCLLVATLRLALVAGCDTIGDRVCRAGSPDCPGPGDSGGIPKDPPPCAPVLPPLDGARVFWLSADTLAAPVDFPTQPGEPIEMVAGQEVIELQPVSGAPPAAFPHLANYQLYRFDSAGRDIAELLRRPVSVVAGSRRTAVQIGPVLDALFAYDGELGPRVQGNRLAFSLWAPTARSVALLLFAAARDERIPMVRRDKGVWEAMADRGTWYGGSYLYEVEVYHPEAGKVVTNHVTDPYSLGLSKTSKRSLIVDLNDPATHPPGWASLVKPPLARVEDAVVYELHVRDFSQNDPKVDPAHRGRYLAFTYDGTTRQLSHGMAHLRNLAQAGLTHVHLLPVSDMASIDEDPAQRLDLDSPFAELCKAPGQELEPICAAHPPGGNGGGRTVAQVLATLDPAGEEIQTVVGALRDRDSFNWGYDPHHYNAPEGSYATTAEGTARIKEFREMIQALNRNGLRVVMDVVYNHTHAAGQHPLSVLDRIVPGYYHRINEETGEVEQSTCCKNTASERIMMERLMVDSLLLWASAYKVDGFRFDLMGHHMKANLLRAKAALSRLPGGDRMLLYGEGWDFGEVAGNRLGENATQKNMAGTGIGTFNDRLRDAVRGGGPFDGGHDLRKRQGFITGLFTDPNELASDPALDLLAVRDAADHIRVGLAGNLASFVFPDRRGRLVSGKDLDYHGSPVGYSAAPKEAITYVSAHDNQTLLDIIQYKLPTGTAPEQRQRAAALGVSLTLLGQGTPFLHAGVELLRSKSMERDSYNSGDWYNRLDFTYQTNNWNVGLPRKDKDGASYAVIRPILADATCRMTPAHIQAQVAHTLEMLRIRRSSPLFGLTTAADVQGRLRFHNTGPGQLPGVIAFSLVDDGTTGPMLDPTRQALFVIVNAAPGPVGLPVENAAGSVLHPVLRNSADPIVRTAAFAAGTFSVPGRTAAVFEVPRAAP